MATSYYEFDDSEAAFVDAERRIEEALVTHARVLDLGGLGLRNLPATLSQLTELKVLWAYHNKLSELPDFLSQLKHLQELNVASNRLPSLPESLLQLKQLEKLVISGNRLTSLPEWLDQFAQLQELWSYRNSLTMLPGSLGLIRELQVLAVSENKLTTLPGSLGRLTHLRRLWLQNNRLTDLPDSLVTLTALEELRLQGNRGLALPPEVLRQIDKPAEIIDYYFRTRRAARPLNEAKLILLGRGEVGKTALVNRLVRDDFKRTTMTRGISITQWPITIGKDTLRLHVWDFGGQEIQHATHQFFLTERSLYLVVLNGRAGAEDEDAEYWLKFIKTFGGSSPTIVVLNKFKVQPFEVNRRALQEKYPFIRAFVETDCKPKTKNGRQELIKNINSALETMEYVRADFPADWFRIKERLAKMQELGESFIAFDEYRKICEELGEHDPQAQERLAGFLNALGIALNFREDQHLREETVLNPHWITEGVYQIITSKVLARQKGELRLADLSVILKSRKEYPPRMYGFLFELMRKFELCFPYQDDPKKRRYLVPELLGKEKPALKEPFVPGECLNFRYDYRLMPEGLLPRFITRTHTMSEPAERWRTGVVLRWEDGRALVEADKQERQVFVRLMGETNQRRRLLAVIRENFDQIHAEMKEFKPTEWVALEGHPEEWVDRQELEVFEHQNETEFRKRVGTEIVSVDVTKVLDDTDVIGARERVGSTTGLDRKLRLFVSYAQLDEKWRMKLKPNLELLQREGLIEIWSDHQIVAGAKWDDEIKAKLESADLYLFLMSTHLLNSDYVREAELPAALKRYDEKKAGLVPVIVQRCSWEKYLGDIEGLPTGGRPVSDWRPYDRACFNIEEGLRKTIEEVRRMLARS
jgi:internalin A